VVADIQFRLMSIFTMKKHQPINQPWSLSLDDVGLMWTKISSNPLHKFRQCAGMEVNRDFNGQTVCAI